MQYPPPGPGYYGNQVPPKSGSNIALIAIIAVVAFVVLAGGGCVVCVMIAGLGAAAANGADAAAPPSTPTSMGERTIERTPLAIKLEASLRNDGIPFDHIECPLNPPASGTFSCAVQPSGLGDPAEVTVTNGPTGMSYKLQEGFVVLDGAKLASTFSTIAARSGSPQMTVPCFTGKTLKHADTSFSCEVRSGGAVVGNVTTNVVGKSGEVKMDYQPNGAKAPGGPAPAPTPNGGSNSLDGTYACLTSASRPGPNGTSTLQFGPSTLPRFTIAGGSYTSGSKTGNFRTSANGVVLFIDGAYDGWEGLLGTNGSGRYIMFRGQNHGDAQPGVAAKVGDSQCYLQK